MPLVLLEETATSADLSTGYELANQLEATNLPMRFGVVTI